MTVASLWKVLDKAGVGKAVGVEDIVNAKKARGGRAGVQVASRRPWNFHETRNTFDPNSRTSLAVDLSIWICESLTSHSLKENNANPHLHLVFSRTIKLLSLGLKLIFVIDGKRRVRSDNGEADKFHKRRRCTDFWKACNDCRQMLSLLGVPVVRAKAEGEALCALLNSKGVVDGVISNDGDCLLFGAKTIFTRFSLENLENGKVLRYDLDDLRAVIDEADEGDIPNNEIGSLQLSRNDLIAFALLTGSDMVGCGLCKVGHKKAVRFIRKCQLDFPLSIKTAALDELRSWARIASHGPKACSDQEKQITAACCSRCCHVGTKRNHEKHGCDVCGTNPGEPCFLVTKEDKFREALKAKAIAMNPPFDPSQVIFAYMRPNDNQLPLQFVNMKANMLQMCPPDLSGTASLRLIIKGRSLESSRDHVIQTVARLLSRGELFMGPPKPEGPTERGRLMREQPMPQRITKLVVHNQIPCYEILWKVISNATDSNGKGIFGYEYTSVEQQELFEARFRDILPRLLSSFKETEKELKKQGDAEQLRRRQFLDHLTGNQKNACDEEQCPSPAKAQQKRARKREGFFHRLRADPTAIACLHAKKRRQEKSHKDTSDDLVHLLRPKMVGFMINKDPEDIECDMNPLEEIARMASAGNQAVPCEIVNIRGAANLSPLTHFCLPETPHCNKHISDSHGHGSHSVLCHMGGFTIQITPITSRHLKHPEM